jgi:hypothetical protein
MTSSFASKTNEENKKSYLDAYSRAKKEADDNQEIYKPSLLRKEPIKTNPSLGYNGYGISKLGCGQSKLSEDEESKI